MEELFTRLFNMVILGAIGYWYRKLHGPRMVPFKVSIYNFVFAVGCIFLMFASAAPTAKVVSGAFACQFTLVGAVHLITNDSEKYKKDADPWINSMILLMVVTSTLILVMDYPNTEPMLHSLIIGYAAAFLAYLFDTRKDKGRREGNL